MPCTITFGEFLEELQTSWDVTLWDRDSAVGDPLVLRRQVDGGFDGCTVVVTRMGNYIFLDDEHDVVWTILRRLRIPENTFDGKFT